LPGVTRRTAINVVLSVLRSKVFANLSALLYDLTRE
jgi:hypothetical protein